MTPEQQRELDRQEVRGHIKQTIWGLIILMVVLGIVGFLFEAQIQRLAEVIFRLFGIPGASIFVLITDSIISPIPPDFALIVISQSEAHNLWYVWVPMLGAISSVAGLVGWQLGRTLGKTRFPAWILGSKLNEGQRLMKKYGAWSVVIGALTPVPFSLTTWSAGMLNAPIKTVLYPSLLRIPRFILYYWVITKVVNFRDILRGFGIDL